MTSRRAAVAALVISLLMTICSGCVQPAVSSSSASEVVYYPDESSSQTFETKPEHLTLQYVDTDSFNPYTCKTSVQFLLCPLLYDGLVVTGPDYSVENRIAQQISCSGSAVTVTLDKTAMFSNGSHVTSSDVVSSFNAAKAPGSHYWTRLAAFSEAVALDEYTVMFSLIESVNDFEPLLNFPVVQSGTESEKYPVGSGRYVLKLDESGNPSRLLSADDDASYHNITLVSAANLDTFMYGVELGTISCHYIDDPDEITVLEGNSYIMADTNRLIYLGCNYSGSSKMTDGTISKIISRLIDRTTIVNRAMANLAEASCVPFTPGYYIHHGGTSDINPIPQYEEAFSMLDELGYTETNEEGYRVNSSGKGISLKLLISNSSSIYSDIAGLIVSQLKKGGISVSVNSYDSGTYKELLETKNWDLYIGEIKLKPDMSQAAFLTPAGTAGYGLLYDSGIQNAYAHFKYGGTIDDYCSYIKDQNTVIPICFRRGALVYSRSIGNNLVASCDDIFYNIEDWDIVS